MREVYSHRWSVEDDTRWSSILGIDCGCIWCSDGGRASHGGGSHLTGAARAAPSWGSRAWIAG